MIPINLLFIHRLDQLGGRPSLTLNGLQLTKEILDQVILDPLILNDNIDVSVAQAQANALPGVKWQRHGFVELKLSAYDMLPQ